MAAAIRVEPTDARRETVRDRGEPIGSWRHRLRVHYAGRSACLGLPSTMFQAIEIDGEPYWEGGYSGNPTITPPLRECKSRDTILVQINPIERNEPARSASEILTL